MNYGIIQNRRHDKKRASGNGGGGASALLQDTRLREMARQMGLDAKDFGHEAAGNLWQLLDDMATNDPGAYQKFIHEQLKDGPPMASQQQQQAEDDDEDDELRSAANTSNNQVTHGSSNAKSPMVLLPRYFAPYPGFVVKCSMYRTVKCQQQETKLFLNCCAHDMVDMPKNPNNGKNVADDTRVVPSTSNLEIPLVVGKLRDVQDVSGSVCVACDVVFHPWVMRRCEWDANFKREVMKLAIQWVQQDAKVRLVNQVGKFIKSRYKGGSIVGAEIVTAKFLVDPSAHTTTSASIGSGNQSDAAEQEKRGSKSQAPSVIESPSELLKQIHLKRNEGATNESPEREFLIKPTHETTKNTASTTTKKEPIASVSSLINEQKISTPASKNKLIQELSSSSPSQAMAASKPRQPTKAKSSAVKKGFLLGAAKAKAPLYPTGSSEGRAPSAYVNLLSRSKVVDLSDVERQKKQQDEEARKLRDEFEFLNKPSAASSSSANATNEVDCGDFEFEQLCMDADPDLKPSQQQQYGANSAANDDPARQLFGEDFEQISNFLSM